MAFFGRAGSILKQSVSKQIGSQISAANPSIHQALRWMSSSKVFVGGLPYSIDDSSLRDTFSQYGEVLDAKVIIDREQQRSRGFGFVTFASTEEASSAIQAMDQQDLQGRRLRVNYAADRAPRTFGGGGFGGGGYGGGGYGGGGYGGGNSDGGGYGGGGYGGNTGGGYGGNTGGGYGGNTGGGYGGNTGGYGGNNGAGSHGVAAGAGDSFFGGGVAGGNVTAETGFASSGFEEGSGFGKAGGDSFVSGSTGAVGNDAGEFEPMGAPVGDLKDDFESDDFAKRA